MFAGEWHYFCSSKHEPNLQPTSVDPTDKKSKRKKKKYSFASNSRGTKKKKKMDAYAPSKNSGVPVLTQGQRQQGLDALK